MPLTEHIKVIKYKREHNELYVPPYVPKCLVACSTAEILKFFLFAVAALVVTFIQHN